ncbi:hypothetical protein WN51_03425 [Melipona quadrifasciata]|uniref:Uncharacterized protein n=1 Tax=Melipona quadrifasciata TaxID=166423 RepID=A0A0N0BEJ7_9HYME|nr:hypothetical protein WN51_03425 [Melipona quadrifasciata]
MIGASRYTRERSSTLSGERDPREGKIETEEEKSEIVNVKDARGMDEWVRVKNSGEDGEKELGISPSTGEH